MNWLYLFSIFFVLSISAKAQEPREIFMARGSNISACTIKNGVAYWADLPTGSSPEAVLVSRPIDLKEELRVRYNFGLKQAAPTAITVTEDNIYHARPVENGVFHVLSTGLKDDNTWILSKSVVSPNLLFFSGNRLLWPSHLRIQNFNITDLTEDSLDVGVGYLNGMALDQDYFYFATPATLDVPEGRITRVERITGKKTILAGKLLQPSGLLVDDTYIYFTAQTFEDGKRGVMVGRLPIDGGKPEPIWKDERWSNIPQLVQDAKYLYVGHSGHAIYRYNKKTLERHMVVTGPPWYRMMIGHLSIDDNTLLWCSGGTPGGVYSFQLPK